MFRKFMLTFTLAAFVATLALSLSPATTQAAKAKTGRVEGTLTAVNTTAMTATITRRNGAAVTVSVTKSTKIERNNKHVSLSSLKIGDHAEARYNPITMVATKLESVGP